MSAHKGARARARADARSFQHIPAQRPQRQADTSQTTRRCIEAPSSANIQTGKFISPQFLPRRHKSSSRHAGSGSIGRGRVLASGRQICIDSRRQPATAAPRSSARPQAAALARGGTEAASRYRGRRGGVLGGGSLPFRRAASDAPGRSADDSAGPPPRQQSLPNAAPRRPRNVPYLTFQGGARPVRPQESRRTGTAPPIQDHEKIRTREAIENFSCPYHFSWSCAGESAHRNPLRPFRQRGPGEGGASPLRSPGGPGGSSTP